MFLCARTLITHIDRAVNNFIQEIFVEICRVEACGFATEYRIKVVNLHINV